MRELTEREKWFRSMVGKVIYRNHNGCTCGICADAYRRGVLVSDERHADYIYDMECESNREEIPLRYFETKEEVTEYEKTITK